MYPDFFRNQFIFTSHASNPKSTISKYVEFISKSSFSKFCCNCFIVTLQQSKENIMRNYKNKVDFKKNKTANIEKGWNQYSLNRRPRTLFTLLLSLFSSISTAAGCDVQIHLPTRKKKNFCRCAISILYFSIKIAFCFKVCLKFRN